MLFPKFWRRQQTTDSESMREKDTDRVRRIDYVKLEERRVLNASFAFDLVAADLTLSDFTNDAFAEDRVDIEQIGDDYVFTLNDGYWMGTDSAEVVGAGTNILTVDSNSIDLINIVANTVDSFDINFGQMSYSGEMSIATLGGFAEFGTVSQDAGTNLNIGSMLVIDGVEILDLQNAGNDFDAISISNVISARLSDVNNVTLDGAVVDTVLSVDAAEIEVTDSVAAQQILFNTSSGIDQATGGDIATSQLILTGSGVFEMDGAANEIEKLAVDIDGSLMLENAASIEFSTLNIDSTEVQGVEITGDFELKTAAANGDVNQTSRIVVAGETFIDAGSGHICLVGGDTTGDGVTNNDIHRFSFTAETAGLLDRNGVVLLDSQAIDRLWIATGDADTDLTDDFGGRITLDGNVDVGNAILFQASSGIIQNSGYLQTQNLLLGGDQTQRSSGTFVLSGDNTISNLAAKLVRDLTITNTVDLNIAELDFNSSCGPTVVIAGVDVGGNLIVENFGDLNQSYLVNIGGTSQFTIDGDVCLINSMNDFGDQVSATADAIEIVDRNELNTGAISAAQQIWLRSGANSIGALELNGDLITNSANGQILLQSNNGIQQNLGIISTTELLLGGDELSESTGPIDLQAANEVQRVAFDVNGDILFGAVTSVQIATATFESICSEEQIEQFEESAATEKVVLSSNQTVYLDAVLSASTLVLNAGDGVVQSSAAEISSQQLVLTGRGFFELGEAANEINELAVSVDGSLSLNEIDGFTIATIDCGSEFVVNGVNLSGNAAIVTAGDLDQQATAPIVVGGETILDTLGQGNICLVGADLNDDGINDNDLNSLEFVSVLNAEFVDANDLEVVGAAVEGQLGVSVGGQLIISGDLVVGTAALLQASSGIVQNDATVTVPDLLLAGNGDFDLQLMNEVNRLAANIDGNLWFTNVVDLTVSELSFESLCDSSNALINGISVGDGEAVLYVDGFFQIDAPVNVGDGTAFFDVASDLNQSLQGIVTAGELGLSVVGSVSLASNNMINVLAGEAGDSLFLNNETDLIIDAVVAGKESEFVASGLSSAAFAKLVIAGDLDVHESINVPAADVFLLVGGDLSQSQFGTIHADGLATVVGGQTVLASDNIANVITANNVGFTLINVKGDVAVGSVIVDGMQSAGLTTENADAKLIVDGDLQLANQVNVDNANALLRVTGNLYQSLVGTITANGLGLMVGGESVLGAANQVNVLAAENSGFTLVTVVNSVVVDSVNVGEMEIAGLSTQSANAKLSIVGDLLFDNAVNVGAGSLLLEVASDLTQSEFGTIVADGLGLMVAGQTVLDADNEVSVFAAEVDGFSLVNVVGDLVVNTVTVNEMVVDGVTASNVDVKLIVGGSLVVESTVDVGTANLLIKTGDDLLQSEDGAIVAHSLGLMVGGDVELPALNQIDVFASELSGQILLNNDGDLEIGVVVVASATEFEMQVSGLESEADIKLNVLGNLHLVNSVVSGQNVFFAVNGDVTQDLTGFVNAGGLGTMVTGETLLSSSNDVDVFAAQNDGVVYFNDVDDLVIATVTAYEGTSFEMTASGIVTSGSDVKVHAADDLLLVDQIHTGFANTFLHVGGNLGQIEMGIITTSELGLMVDGTTVLSLDNDATAIAAQNGGYIVYNEINDLVVDSASVFEGSELQMSVEGISTLDSDVKLIVAGDLALHGVVQVENSDIGLVVGGELIQSTYSSIRAGGLSLMVAGSSQLGVNNDIDVFSASNGGSIRFGDINDVVIGSVDVLEGTDFGMQTIGVTVDDGDFKIAAHGDLMIVEPVSIQSGVFFVVATGQVNQSEIGTIVAAEFGMMVAGDVRLDAANNVDVFAANNSALTLLRDIGDLTIFSVVIDAGTEYEMSVTGLNTGTGSAKLIVADDLVIKESVIAESGTFFLDVGGETSQTTNGFLSVMSFGMMVDGSVNLLADNRVQTIAAGNFGATKFKNIVDLTIGSVTLDSMTINGLVVDSDLEMQVSGDLNQSHEVIVGGETLLHVEGKVCLTGNDFGASSNQNDFVGILSVTAGSSVEIEDANTLTVMDIVSSDQIRLRSGDGGTGAIILQGKLETVSQNGQVLLQSDNGVFQDSGAGRIISHDLLLGSATKLDARSGDFILLGANSVSNIAADLEQNLEFNNIDDLNISPLQFVSQCDGLSEEFNGVNVGSVSFIVEGSLTDSPNAETRIQSYANWIVDADILLGDGDARLEFTGQSISNLIGSKVSLNRLTIGASDWHAQNVSLYVDSTVILGDVFVSDLLFIDTIESDSGFESAGDILQSMASDNESTQIRAAKAAFVARASVQLTNTHFEQLAIESHSVSQLIDPFVRNIAIGSTFTGSIDSNVFNNESAPTFLLGGDPAVPLNGVQDVDQDFLQAGFFANNNQFVNPNRVGAITVNGLELDLVSFDALGLNELQLENVLNSTAAATALGDIYVESEAGYDLNVMADVDTLSRLSNTTIIAGKDLTLADGAEFKRLNLGELIGLVNQLQIDFSLDAFIEVDPRSVIDAPGDLAFSDLNAQLDNAVGYQNFEFYFGNPGERSFNMIVGWFVDHVTPGQAVNAEFQKSLVQAMSDITEDFLLSDFSNFGQGISAYSIEFDSQLPSSLNPLGLTNGAQFDRLFFGDRSYLLSQIFLTNDAKINLFENAGSTDLNFSQEVLPTRTVVENPSPIMVSTPEFDVPESVGVSPQATNVFVNFIPDAESPPLTTDQQPESYFLIRYTADDDGVFEESFKWDDANDDPDAIRSIIEDAQLIDGGEEFWPETSGDDEGGWFEKIKNGNKVKPGLYFIFEVQEGQMIPDPVDAPVDRTDIENLVEPESASETQGSSDPDVSSLWRSEILERHVASNVDSLNTYQAIDFECEIDDPGPPEAPRSKFSAATQKAMLGSSLLLAQTLLHRKPNQKGVSKFSPSVNPNSKSNVFSRASRILRRQNRNSS